MEAIKEDIKIIYDFLRHREQTEIRAIVPAWKGKGVISKFVETSEDFINEIEKLNGQYNVYVGLNERKKEGKEDSDVKWITNIGHDIDAHQGGEDSKVIAYQIAMNMREDFIAKGYNEPLIVDSGRGFWVIHHIEPIENTELNCKKIKHFGLNIKKTYEQKGVEIDTTVYNPSRIARVCGTVNISDEKNIVISRAMNNPSIDIDTKLKEKILSLELPEYKPNIINSNKGEQGICSFMDYCLTHEVPKGERHKVISRNMAIYLAKHPQRDLLKEQYIKVQSGGEGELDGWLKNIDEQGLDKFPFSIGELVNFTKKYKIPFDWKVTPEYQNYIKQKKAEKKLKVEVEKEKKAEMEDKAIKFFTDKKHLAKQFLKVQPIFFDKAKLWWVWNKNKKCWEVCDETDIMNYISDSSEANTVSSKERGEILEALRQEARRIIPKPIKPYWIQFKDTIVDIKTSERFEATSEYFVTNPLPWSLGEDEDTPNMDRIFTEWVGEEYKQTLYEILAYCMMPDYPINRLFCFIGSGLNGKSKFLDLLHKFIGAENSCTTELDTLLTSRFEITRLHKKLVCMMGETNFNEMSKTSILKKLTGGDLIGFEYKNKNPFDEKNYAKIIIATNNLPTTTDKTIGFYRRWMIIDFPNKFSEKKDILAEIPEEEYESLALKCCSILKELLEKREFTNEGTIEQRTEKYESKSNFLEKFLKEATCEDVNGYITSADFFKRFSAWSKENRHREMSETSVGVNMKKLGVEQERKYFNWLYDGKGGQLKCWIGITWKN